MDQRTLDKIPFHTALAQNRIDLFKLLAQTQVVHIANDGWQDRTQFLREGNNVSRHGASLQTSLQACH
jgi:hypothetical protein